MAAPKGQRPPNAGKGRKRGTANKLTRDIKAAIENAFVEVGGEKYLVRVAKRQPAVFCKLLGQVLPKEITGLGGGPIPVAVVNVHRSSSTAGHQSS